jgi:hypothetical protein
VLFTAALSASPGAPTDGQVNFTASSGESCVDTTPMRTSAQSVDFSCEIVFSAPGVSTVVAEFVGSIVHAYSGSSPKTHTALDARFADGFETP